MRLEFAAASIIQSKGHKGSFYLVLAFFSPVRVIRSRPKTLKGTPVFIFPYKVGESINSAL